MQEPHADAPDPDQLDLDTLGRAALVDRAVHDRRRRAAIADRQLERTDLVSVLLGARGRNVGVHLSCGGEGIRGSVVTVGGDVVELVGTKATWWLRLTDVVAVEAPELGPGDPADRTTIELADIAAELVGTDRRVTALMRGGAQLTGTIRAAGDALWLERRQPDRQIVIDPDQLVGLAC